MFIHSHFSSFAPPRSFWSPSQSCRCTTGPGGGIADNSMFSARARMFMLMNAFSGMMQGFQGHNPLPMQSPSFGRPGGVGSFGPTRCFFGPSPRRQPSEFGPRTPKAQTPTPTPPIKASSGASVKPLAQSNSISCGQTSVAMAVNSLTGKSLNDKDINKRYGFGLLSALNGESRASGYSWRDGGNFTAGKWGLLEKKLNKEKTPVLIGLNGPKFSPSGRGHIVTLLSVNGNSVKYADPADGKIKTTTRQAIERAPSHPDGKFIFYANKA